MLGATADSPPLLELPGLLMMDDLRPSSTGHIRTVAENYSWVTDIEQTRYWYRLTCILKPIDGLTPDMIVDLPPRRVRYYLLIQAENLLSALRREGWQLADGTVDLSFRTDISGPLMALAGLAVDSSRESSTIAEMKILIMREIEL